MSIKVLTKIEVQESVYLCLRSSYQDDQKQDETQTVVAVLWSASYNPASQIQLSLLINIKNSANLKYLGVSDNSSHTAGSLSQCKTYLYSAENKQL